MGTYAQGNSEGIYRFSFHETTGKVEDVTLFAKIKDSKYLVASETHVFSLYGEGNQGGIAVLDWEGNCLEQLLFEEGVSCYLKRDGDFLYTCNYHSGTVTKLSFRLGKLKVEAQTVIAEKAGAHQVVPFQKNFLIPCLNLDKIVILNESMAITGEIPFPKGSGCRHAVVSKTGDFLYVIGELSNKIHCISLKTQEILTEISILPVGIDSLEGGAALRCSDDGKTLYASTRGTVNQVIILAVNGEIMEIRHSFP